MTLGYRFFFSNKTLSLLQVSDKYAQQNENNRKGWLNYREKMHMDCGGFMLELPQSHNSTLQEKEIVSLLGRGTIKIIPQLETQRGFFSSGFFLLCWRKKSETHLHNHQIILRNFHSLKTKETTKTLSLFFISQLKNFWWRIRKSKKTKASHS